MHRKVLVFVFFLVISSLMWLMVSLNEEMEKDMALPVVYANVPENVVITSDINDTVRLTVRDKGYTLARYIYGKGVKPVVVNFTTYATNNGTFTIGNSDLLRLAKRQLSTSTQVLSVKPDRLEVFFNHGNHKTVPVVFQGKVKAGASYVITQTEIHPRQASIYAADGLLDSINAVYTEPVNGVDITDSVSYTVRVQHIRGAKIVPNKVRVDLRADLLTENTVDVPVTILNLPEGKNLRLFPSTVKVKFVLPSKMYASVQADDFLIVADYNDLLRSESDKLGIAMRRKPANVRNVKMEIRSVSYLIEEQ